MAEQFFNLGLTKLAMGQWLIGYLLKSFKYLTAFRTLILVYRHCYILLTKQKRQKKYKCGCLLSQTEFGALYLQAPNHQSANSARIGEGINLA